MGWASGSYLAQDVWSVVREHIPPKSRGDLARRIYEMFCREDADDWSPDSDLLKDAGIKFGEEE